MNLALAAVIAFLATAGLPARAAPPERDAGHLPVIDVPFVSQSERLCGGAAAAMVMRAAGARGVYAEQFASLVDEASGGIHTRDLAAALGARGYRIAVSNGTAETLQLQLAQRRPALVLLQDRPGRYHYVVIVGWTRRAVVFHDPARAPFVTRTPEQFDSAWRATGRWMLTIVGAPSPAMDALSGAVDEPSPSVSSERERATQLFVERNYADAARFAERAAAIEPRDALAWRLLAASRYLEGDEGRALDAWNRAGDPRLDLVELEGLARTPHRVVERLIGLSPGSTLTRVALARAQRRLTLLPAAQTSRISYTALPGNLAEVRGAIVERPLVPSRVEWTAAAARAAIDRDVLFSIANAGSAGDRLVASWRFWEARPRVGLDYELPSPLGGVWGLSSSWQEEHYADAAKSEVRDARITWTNWPRARLRLSAGSGIARWTGRATAALLDAALEYRPLNEMTSFEISMSGAGGSAQSFSTTNATARWRAATTAVKLFGAAAVSRASSDAPLDRWPGAGGGHARPLLLRAHPLLGDNGRIEGPVFGRTVAQATIEAQRDIARRGLLAVGVATFADAARAWERVDGSTSPLHVDVGVGLRLRMAPGMPALRIDIARGLQDRRVALTAGWQMTWWTRGAR